MWKLNKIDLSAYYCAKEIAEICDYAVDRVDKLNEEAREKGEKSFFSLCGNYILIRNRKIEVHCSYFDEFSNERKTYSWIESFSSSYISRIDFLGRIVTQYKINFEENEDFRNRNICIEI